MDNPLFGGSWSRFPERRSYQRPHYCHPNPYAANSFATPVKSETTSKVKAKKIVSIPINFVDSETPKSKKAPAMDENTAAVKIQSAFLGFCVRKSRPLNKLRVIMKTKAEAAEIQRRVNDEHVVELIRRDEKERVKMTEWIMSLLLRLDEIQGVIPFVRESRKVVILELVNLEETVDDIIAAKPRQDAATEISVTPEATVEDCTIVEENGSGRCLEESPNEEFKRKELPGGAIEVSVSSEKALAEESLPSPIQDLQIEGSPEEDNNNIGVEDFKQSSSEAGKIVSGTMVDVVDKDAENLKRNKVESLLLEADPSPAIPYTEEGVQLGNSRDDEEAGDEMTEQVKPIEDIGLVREENEKLIRSLSDLLKKSEKQSEIIHDLSLRVSQLEEQVSRCNKKKKVGDGKKKSDRSTKERDAHTNNRRIKSNSFMEDWF
ncbi:hypothetical protein SUGI_1025310 [Cryptomeria japonica]|uniref:uncharacterized protein LOC131859508 n=1 Tax=Cryptomeria japonica TaxID=3369 RepID=UPI0024149C0D|nr:uncharacterized protein LOC131859508 [Cryptomeria japonica]GLJ48596.1 hypothetical protein SUGI_1025310 [Cryptomeria japonica]